MVDSGVGNVNDIVLSKSSAKSQVINDQEQLVSLKFLFPCFEYNAICQINLDGKLLKDLPGLKLSKVNRLAVFLILITRLKLLRISTTDDSTGEGAAKRILEEWSLNDGFRNDNLHVPTQKSGMEHAPFFNATPMAGTSTPFSGYSDWSSFY